MTDPLDAAGFEAAIEAVIADLHIAPWDVVLISRLRLLAITRQARGFRGERPFFGGRNDLIQAYRKMAADPGSSQPVLAIGRLAKQVAQAAGDPAAVDAQRVYVWAKELLSAMRS